MLIKLILQILILFITILTMFGNYEDHRQRVLGKLAGEGRILDLGCAQRPNKHLQGKPVVGLDINDMELEPPYVEHLVCDITKAKSIFDDRKFDTVVMGEFIEHIEQPYEVLRSVRDFIAPDGRLILSTPNPLGIPVFLAEYLCLRKYYYTSEHVFYFSPRWVWRLLEKSGFEIIKTVGCGASIAGYWMPAPTSLSYIVVYVAKPR